jgi:hypothetical protein
MVGINWDLGTGTRQNFHFCSLLVGQRSVHGVGSALVATRSSLFHNLFVYGLFMASSRKEVIRKK